MLVTVIRYEEDRLLFFLNIFSQTNNYMNCYTNYIREEIPVKGFLPSLFRAPESMIEQFKVCKSLVAAF